MSEVVVVIGAGLIGQAIARRVSAGKHLVLSDLHQKNADAAADVLSNAGFDVSTVTVDVSSRQSIHALVETAAKSGDVTGLIHAAGVSPSQASPETILAVDLYGTAVVLEEFGSIIARGGAGVVIASQSGHRLGALTDEQNAALATTPADESLTLPMLQPDQLTDSLHAYQLALPRPASADTTSSAPQSSRRRSGGWGWGPATQAGPESGSRRCRSQGVLWAGAGQPGLWPRGLRAELMAAGREQVAPAECSDCSASLLWGDLRYRCPRTCRGRSSRRWRAMRKMARGSPWCRG